MPNRLRTLSCRMALGVVTALAAGAALAQPDPSAADAGKSVPPTKADAPAPPAPVDASGAHAAERGTLPPPDHAAPSPAPPADSAPPRAESKDKSPPEPAPSDAKPRSLDD